MVAPRTIEEHAVRTRAIADIYERYLLELYGWMHEANVENQSSSYEFSKDTIQDMAESVHRTRENIDRVIYEALEDIAKGIHVYQPPKPEKEMQIDTSGVDYDDMPY